MALPPALVRWHRPCRIDADHVRRVGVWVRLATFVTPPDSHCAGSAISDGQRSTDWLRSAHFRFFIPDGLASSGAFSSLHLRVVRFVSGEIVYLTS
jgi:hypothetical protein